MVERIKAGASYKLADFERAGTDIAKQVPNYRTLLQQWTIRAFEHLAVHGNFLILKPLWNAANSFGASNTGSGNAEGRRWRAYVIEFTWLKFNPANLNGPRLRDATYESLWLKDRSKNMRIDEAKSVNWWEFTVDRQTDAKPGNLTAAVATIFKRIQRNLNAGMLLNDDGMPATPAQVRAAVRAAFEALRFEPITKAVPATGNKTDAKLATKARKANDDAVKVATHKARKAPAKNAGELKKAA